LRPACLAHLLTRPLTFPRLLCAPAKTTATQQQRAHTIISRAFSPTSEPDSLACAPDPRQLLSLLMEPGDPPPFSQAFKDANKGASQSAALDEDMMRDAELPAFAF
jgi:hypothetical protein